ncbi:MAG: folate-binding protein [Pseudomonadota bacterium]
MTETAIKLAIPLADRVVIAVSGPDACSFLEGLVTVDTEALAVGDAGHGALLTPQGKLQFDFIVLRTAEDAYLMDVPRATAADFMKRLLFYRLRAQVEIRHAAHLAVASFPDGLCGSLPDESLVFADPRNEKLGQRAFVATTTADETLGEAGYSIAPANSYHARRIAAGIPEALHDFEYGTLFPHDIALDQTGGVDFHKGCFVGQEVVSRMQHRGTARRRVVHVLIAGPAPASGAALSLSGKNVGEMGSHEGDIGLAIIRLDRAADALTGTPLESENSSLLVKLPEWSDYAVAKPDSTGESAA